MTGKGANYGLHHHVHAGELRPNLGKDPDSCAIEHLGLEELEVGDIGVFAFKFTHVLDLAKFLENKGGVEITFCVDEGQDLRYTSAAEAAS